MHAHGFPFRVLSPRPSVPGLTRSSVVQVLYFLPREYLAAAFGGMTIKCRCHADAMTHTSFKET